jgi:hypothetical protein
MVVPRENGERVVKGIMKIFIRDFVRHGWHFLRGIMGHRKIAVSCEMAKGEVGKCGGYD